MHCATLTSLIFTVPAGALWPLWQNLSMWVHVCLSPHSSVVVVVLVVIVVVGVVVAPVLRQQLRRRQTRLVIHLLLLKTLAWVKTTRFYFCPLLLGTSNEMKVRQE